MREGIRQRLIAEVSAIGDRVFEPHAADAKTAKPYAVIVQGSDSEDSDWSGFRRLVEIWPYVSWTNFTEVDALCKSIIDALADQLITDPETGEMFTCRYEGTLGDDTVDEDWQAITRGLRFSVLALQPTGNVGYEQPADPWLAALAEWSHVILGSQWTIFHTAWPLGYARPAVLWRIAGVELREVSAAAVELRKRFVGHVIGTTQTEQNAAIVLTTWKLKAAIKLPLDVATRRYLTVIDPKADHQADGLRTGQITVTLSRKEARSMDAAPMMAEFYQQGNLL
ncbi:hypothetical protein K7P76_28585 [Cohnella sp. NL03-T5]|nr:hypothetical protein [Cohnella silvisoli]